MTAASNGAAPGDRLERQWDVALSFAGAQRDYVGQVAQVLKAHGIRCFYDADEHVRLWGTHLAEELPRIYAQESAAVVVFVSADYAGRDWTRLERRAAFSRAVADAGVYVLPARFDDSELPGLLPDVVTVDLRGYSPAQFADLVIAKLADLGAGPSSLTDRPARRPTGGARVRDADLRRLGVHAAISVPGVPDGTPPEYVPRDVDGTESGIRASITAAAHHGGFVLVVGGSSVGKTRCAAEAVKALLQDWWLVHPAGASEIASLARMPAPRTVVWLDELQRYLGGETGLNGGTVRALLGAQYPVVIIGTLWPELYAAYTNMPVSGADPHGREREILDLATVVRVDSEFSAEEHGRARTAAVRDPRLRVALEAAGYGLTQTLAAAPQLVARWQDARTAAPYAWAVISAALDIARLGGRAPVNAELLRAAAPGYCTSQQQAEAPDDWFEQAIAYATTKLRGAAATLSPAGAGMGQVAGYTAADYLIQYASRERRSARVPATTWDAVLCYVRDPGDAARLADSAEGRLLYRYAIPLYLRAVDAGDMLASMPLAGLLGRSRNLDGLRTRADAGDWIATGMLALLLAEDEEPNELRALADAGGQAAAENLADLLAKAGDLDGLRARADAGDGPAASRLAALLAERGNPDEAEQVLRTRADTGDGRAAMELAGLLTERGDLAGAAQILRIQADADTWEAAQKLADLMAEAGDLDGLRARADAGELRAASRLADLLADRGDLAGAAQILPIQAYSETRQAARNLADLMAEAGDLDGLRARADAGDREAAVKLAELLAEAGDLDGLRARADAGDLRAASRLADLLADRGDLAEATQILRSRADAGDPDAAMELAGLLYVADDLDGVRVLAEASVEYAASYLAEMLARRGDLDGLRAWVRTGEESAAWELGRLLTERGDLDGLRALVTASDQPVGRLAELLVGQLTDRGEVENAEQFLRARAYAGYGDTSALAELLIRQGRSEEAARLRRFGLNPDGSTADA